MQLTAKHLLAIFRGGDQSVQIDTGGDTHGLEQAHQILGADVARVATAIFHLRRMAADAAERAVEMADASLVRGDVVDEPGAARVVEVRDRCDPRRLAPEALFAPETLESFVI